MTSTDVELLHRYLERQDTGALDELFGRHYAAVYRVVRKLVHDEFDANDIAQATFLAAVRSGRRAAPPQSFRAWLLAIAINEVRQFARARRRRRIDWLAEACLPDPAGSAADVAARREFERALEDAIHLLPPRLKEPLVLHYYESLPLGAVGEILALPRSTVQTRVAAAVDRLRRAFRRRGHAALLPLLDLRLAPPGSAVAATGVFARLFAGVMAMNGKQFAAVVVAAFALALGTVGVVGSMLAPRDPALATPVAAVTLPARREVAAPAPDGVTESALAGERQAVAPPLPMVFGQVVDAARGAPVADAEVTLFEFATATTATLRTDGDGRYAFAGSRGSAGLFQLVITKSGFGRLAAAEVVTALQPRRDVLAAGLSIRGRVVEAAGGRPVPAFSVLAARLPFQNASEWDSAVSLHRQAIPEPLRTDAAIEVADADGSFCLRDLAHGSYVLVIAAPDRQPLFWNGGGRSYDRYRGIEAAPEDEATPVEIVLPPVGHAFVEVVGRADGAPLRSARVRNRVRVDHGEFVFNIAHASGNAGNRFELPMALDERGKLDDVDCLVTADGYAASTISCSGQDDGETFVVALGRAATVHGRVCVAAGRPLANATVLIECDSNGRLVGNACTDADGRYRIDGLDAPSATTLHCLAPGLSSVLATLPLQLADGETRELDIFAGAAASAALHGTVSVRGVPQRGALVILDAPTRAEVRCETRADGTFAFAGLQPGRYELTVVLDAGSIHNLRVDRIVEVGTNAQRIDFDFGRRVTGSIRDVSRSPAPAGAREPDFEVVASLVGAEGASDRADVRADGTFELLVAAPGCYELSIDGGEDWVTVAPVPIDLRERDAIDGLELQVARDMRDARIELHFVDQSSGLPVSGELRYTHGRSQTSATVEDGLYVEEQGSLGVYRCHMSSDTHRPVVFEVQVLPGQKKVERRIALAPSVDVVVIHVAPGGAAHRAGMRAGDVLRRYGGVAIHSVAGLRAAIAAATGVVTIVVARAGVESALVVDAGELGVEIENAR